MLRGAVRTGLVSLLALLSGCGLGGGSAAPGVTLTITDDFGAKRLLETREPQVRPGTTALSLLERVATASTRAGDGTVQSIEGRAGVPSPGRPDWFLYVNGIAAPTNAVDVPLHDGDRVWWDRHPAGFQPEIPAVVGAFPEPFVHGSAGKRLPVRVECAVPGSPACRTVVDRLVALGVVAASGSLDLSSGGETLRVLVGSLTALRGDPVVATLGLGPMSSGVYARPGPDGRTLSLLDPTGRVSRVLGSGAGLVAAARQGDHQPVWIVTGSDPAGLQGAATALSTMALRDRFAVALDRGRPIAVPDLAVPRP